MKIVPIRFNIRTSLYALFGLCAAVMSGQAVVALREAVGELQSAASIGEAARANRELFVAIQNLRLERGPTRVALDAKTPADPKLIADVAAQRERAKPAVEALLAACTQITCASGDVVGTIRSGFNKVNAVRQHVDAGFRQPLAERRQGLSKEWYDASSALIEELERVSLALTEKVRMAGPEFAELVVIKESAWIVRDAFGLARPLLMDEMSTKALSAGGKVRLATLRGQADAGWRVVKAMSARTGVPTPVVAAVRRTQADVFDDYVKTTEALEKALAEGRPPAINNLELVARSNKALDTVVAVCGAALDEIVAVADQQSAQAQRHLAGYGLLLAMALLIGGCGFLVAWRRIARPIGVISQAMLRMAEGQLDAEMPHRGRHDEIGDVARAGHSFRESLIRMRAMEAEQKTKDEQMAADRRVAMQALADHFEASVGQIINAVSSAATQLEAAAGTLTHTAESTEQRSGSVAAASEQASASVQSVASATEEMTTSVQEISRQVHESSRIAAEAVEQAKRTDARIAELSQAASRIGDVVKLITAVAEQTNLLALNATIEAARAGEAGRGFAVVAQEVKALAGQTAKATEEIGTQIAGMQAATRDSVASIKEIGATIARVADIAGSVAAAVEEQGTATREIAGNVSQAARGTTEVAANIVEVNRGATETGAASAQVLASAKSLAGDSAALKREVKHFLESVRAA